MLLLLDTCFCSHCEELYSSNVFDIRTILSNLRCAITDEGMKEIHNFGLDKFIIVDELLVIDTKDLKIEHYFKINDLIRKLDETDQLLWILGYKNKKEEYVILTDDGGLYLNCQIFGIPTMRLPSFLLFLCESDLISKNQVAKCLKFWESNGRFAKKDLKRWGAYLIQIR